MIYLLHNNVYKYKSFQIHSIDEFVDYCHFGKAQFSRCEIIETFMCVTSIHTLISNYREVVCAIDEMRLKMYSLVIDQR